MNKNCYACGAEKLKNTGSTTCYSKALSENSPVHRELLRCTVCGSVSVYPQLSAKDLEQYYNNYAEKDSGSEDNSRWEKRPAYHVVQDICKTLGKGKVLDVGCGNGGLLSLLPESFQKHGIDISEKNHEQAQKKGISFLYRSLDPAMIPDRFDLIIALDFIEHVYDPGAILDLISKLLAPGGYVIIETGCANSLFAKFLKNDWSYTAVYGHVCALSSNILCKLADKSRIRKVSLKTSWHATTSPVTIIKRNTLSTGFHVFRRLYRTAEPFVKNIDYLKKLYFHPPPVAPHPDHMIFIGQKELHGAN